MKAEVAAKNTPKPVRILVAGGCYAGLAAAITILERCDSASPQIPVSITIVDERDGFYHVIGTPLALADKAYAERAWVPFRDVTILQRSDVQIVHGSVKSVNLQAKTAVITKGEAETSEKYDFFIGATGLRRVWPAVPQSHTRSAYLEEVGRHVDAVAASKHPILVVGGGAVGIEIAAELTVCHSKAKVILAHSRDKLLSAEPLPDAFKDRALKSLQAAGVEVLVNHRLESSNVTEDGANEVKFTSGEKLVVGVVIMAISKSVPSTNFLPKEALNEEGFVNVSPSLQLSGDLPNAEYHFAAGDMINWSGIKRCGGAMHMGKLVAFNLYQIILRDQSAAKKKLKFKEMRQVPPMITIAVGREAVSYAPWPMGISSGKRMMKIFFEDDLGFRIIWDYLRLGEEPGSNGTWMQSLGHIMTFFYPESRSYWTKLHQRQQRQQRQQRAPAVVASSQG